MAGTLEDGMAKRAAIANLIEYDNNGASTAKPVRLSAWLCTGQYPQIFEIVLPDKRATRNRSISITRAEIERVLAANPDR